MRLVADESVDLAIVIRLREDGHEVLAVSESSPAIPDEEVLGLAASSLLVTADKDFDDLVFRQRYVHSGVLLLRLGGMPALEKGRPGSRVLEEHGPAISTGFAVLSSRTLRIRQPTAM